MLPQQLNEMYSLCINDTRERIQRMRGSAEERDCARFIRDAHAIKGSAGMLGATQLHTMASELETRGLDGADGISATVNSLDELSAACDCLERMLGTRA
jgi:HPt (histidine-containing phosphotransfer) domain-containing protein